MCRASVMARLHAGDVLHMQIVDGQRMWWFDSPWMTVSDHVAQSIQKDGHVVEAGDSLFGLPQNSQSWRGRG